MATVPAPSRPVFFLVVCTCLVAVTTASGIGGHPAAGASVSASSSTAAAATSSAVASRGPRIVQRLVVTVPGLQGSTPGPRSITVRFPHPTRRGDLLLAGVDDGVQTSGMGHAHYQFPRWHRAAATIGGLRAATGRASTGGLQAAIYFYPDNPGGIVSVHVATIPARSLDWVSVVLVELDHTPLAAVVDSAGTATNGPSSADFTQVSTVRTRARTRSPGELAVAVFNNGDNSPDGIHFVHSSGWTVAGAVHDPDDDQQPILLDFRVVRRRAVVSETDQYVGTWGTDNCAVIVALR